MKSLNVFSSSNNKLNIQSDFKKIVAFIRENTKLKVNGFYNILVHELTPYGYIIEFDRRYEEDDDFDDDEDLGTFLEMKVVFKFHEELIIELNDINYFDYLDNIEHVDLYLYYNLYYLVIKLDHEDKNNIDQLLEYGKIYFHDETFKREGTKIFEDISTKKLSF